MLEHNNYNSGKHNSQEKTACIKHAVSTVFSEMPIILQHKRDSFRATRTMHPLGVICTV